MYLVQQLWALVIAMKHLVIELSLLVVRIMVQKQVLLVITLLPLVLQHVLVNPMQSQLVQVQPLPKAVLLH